MDAIMKYLILFLVFLAICNCQEDPRLPCRLEWIKFDSGNVVPVNAVRIQEEKGELLEQLVVRGTLNGERKVGRYEPKEELAYFPFTTQNDNATSLMEFELLVNTFGCRVMWTMVDSQFRVGVQEDGGSSGYVGRGSVPDFDFDVPWYGGHISSNGQRMEVPLDDGTETEILSSGFQFLVSYSAGLSLIIENFEFLNGVPPLQRELSSQEEIHNESPASVTQSLSFSKSINEKLEVTITKEFVSKQTSSMGYNVIIYGKQVTTTQEYKRTETTVVTTETKTNVTTILDFTVAPFSSVRACSIVEMAEGVDLEFSAIGVYSAPSMSPEAILSIVKSDLSAAQIVNDRVIIPVSGIFQTSIAMNNRFAIVPFDDEDDDCSQQPR